MVELLVSLLIFTFGMLGLAGLQTRTLTFNQSSLFRSQASALTDDILDRMRSDRNNATLGRWDVAVGTASSAMPNTAFYEIDSRDWKTQVEGLLPSGQASIVTETAAGADAGVVTITIQCAHFCIEAAMVSAKSRFNLVPFWIVALTFR